MSSLSKHLRLLGKARDEHGWDSDYFTQLAVLMCHAHLDELDCLVSGLPPIIQLNGETVPVTRLVRVSGCTVNTISVSSLHRFENPAVDEEFYLIPADMGFRTPPPSATLEGATDD